MTLIGICGNLGSGKTLFLTYLGYKAYKKGIKVYANYNLKFPHTYMDENDFKDFNIQNGIFLGDELWAWLDSRKSQKKDRTIQTKILLSSRKKGVEICYTAQRLHQIDKRIRNITDIIVVCENQNDVFFKYYIYDLRKFPPQNHVKILNMKPVFKLYNTNEII